MGAGAVIVIIGLLLGAWAYLDNDSFMDTLDKGKELAEETMDNVDIETFPENQTLEDFNISSIEELDELIYANVGGIMKEVGCSSNKECNDFNEDCSQGCFCVSSSCLKFI